MKHLVVFREYPPAPGGGIGTYTAHMARALAAAGDHVHVVAQTARGAEDPTESLVDGRLTIHRIPFERPGILRKRVLRPAARRDPSTRILFRSDYFPEAFAFRVADVVARLIEREAIDVIEAPEYEAPLYHLLQRRGGHGTTTPPPVLVHLHSPTEDIVRHNGWNAASAFVRRACELERACIRDADGLVAPSRFLADLIERRFGLPSGAIPVIPYPLGERLRPRRIPDVWARGSILYFGRLEGRKGALEWMTAAVRAATRFPQLRFEFLGDNLLDEGWRSGRQVVAERIPRALRSRFVFHGAVPREQLAIHLGRARIVVTPSRWDNFPNACMEAMAAGLPVLATREGGMAEMIDPGRTGWLAERPDPEALYRTLVEAVQTPADRVEEMGRAAAIAIGEMCETDTIVARHRALREELVARHSNRAPRAYVAVMPREELPGSEEDSIAVPAVTGRPTLISQLVTHPVHTARFLVQALGRRVRHRFRGR